MTNKKIYNLEIGDSYWIKELCTGFVYKPIEKYIKGRHSLKLVKAYVENGELFLTEEECQKSIDYDVALSKINKRASELEERYTEIDATDFYVIWNIEEDLYVNMHSKTNAFKLAFKDLETAIIIKEELPEECRIVLEVD